MYIPANIHHGKDLDAESLRGFPKRTPPSPLPTDPRRTLKDAPIDSKDA